MTRCEVVPAPRWLLRLVVKVEPRARPVVVVSTATRFGDTALDRAVREVEAAPQGRGNAVLNGNAYSVGRLVGAGLLDQSTVEAALVDAAVRRGGETEARARAIVESGVGAGMAKPRRVARFEAVNA